MSNTVIKVENLGKRYKVGHQSAKRERYTALRDVISREAQNFVRKASDLLRGKEIIQGDEVEDFWALRNVNFEIKQGDVVGIVGRNGAGKSTLLKILSRITEPTEGRIELHGRVASLLEVGTGFHPELTGRENIFLNGAILGMTQAEIRKKFDEIVAFAEVERFLDTPVKRYSSGMFVRLAFAVAAHLEPEILVIDEVLAVGDAEFQKKCLGKMDDVARREGRTVLFVSHNMGIVSSLCPSAIWLQSGQVYKQGATRDIIAEYLVHGSPNQERVIDLEKRPRPYREDGRLQVTTLEWLSDVPLCHGRPVKARIHFKTRGPVANIAVGIGFASVEGKRLLSYDTDFQTGFRPSLSNPGSHMVEIEIDSLPLGPDIYNVSVGVRSGDSYALDYVAEAVQLEVIAGPKTPGFIVRKDAGVRLESNWTWLTEEEMAAPT